MRRAAVALLSAATAVAIGAGCTTEAGIPAKSAASRAGSVTAGPATTSGAVAARSNSSAVPRGVTTSPGPRLTPVPTVAETTLPASPLLSDASFGNGFRARVTDLTFGKVTETGPGQLTGRPTITFHLALYNGTRTAASLDGVSVNAYYGSAKTPAVPADLAATSPFHGRIAAGHTATGAYAFAIPTAQQHKVTLTVWYAQGAPTVVLRGSAR